MRFQPIWTESIHMLRQLYILLDNTVVFKLFLLGPLVSAEAVAPVLLPGATPTFVALDFNLSELHSTI